MRRGENRGENRLKSTLKTGLKAGEIRVKTGGREDPHTPIGAFTPKWGCTLNWGRPSHADAYFETGPGLDVRLQFAIIAIWDYTRNRYGRSGFPGTAHDNLVAAISWPPITALQARRVDAPARPRRCHGLPSTVMPAGATFDRSSGVRRTTTPANFPRSSASIAPRHTILHPSCARRGAFGPSLIPA